MKIVAFLQNPWFRAGIEPRHVAMYRENQDFHRRVLAMSATGRALIRAFGEELYGAVHWDNACPNHGFVRGATFPPDVEWMARVFAAQRPDVVLLFGKQAQVGWDEMEDAIGMKNWNPPHEVAVFGAPHPMARGSAQKHIERIAADVKKIYFAQR